MGLVRRFSITSRACCSAHQALSRTPHRPHSARAPRESPPHLAHRYPLSLYSVSMAKHHFKFLDITLITLIGIAAAFVIGLSLTVIIVIASL